MCKVFPSSLGLMAMRWFDSFKEGSIHSFEELTRAFKARFVTCSWVPRPLDYLLSMFVKEGESLKNYFDRNWEIYNEIDGDFKDVVVQTFKVGFLHTLTYGNCLLWNCLGVWIGLRSLKGSRTTKTLAREKPRFSPLPEGIACRVDSHLLNWGGSFFSEKKRDYPLVTSSLDWTRGWILGHFKAFSNWIHSYHTRDWSN